MSAVAFPLRMPSPSALADADCIRGTGGRSRNWLALQTDECSLHRAHPRKGREDGPADAVVMVQGWASPLSSAVKRKTLYTPDLSPPLHDSHYARN